MQIVVSLSGSEVDLDLVGVFMLVTGESVGPTYMVRSEWRNGNDFS